MRERERERERERGKHKSKRAIQNEINKRLCERESWVEKRRKRVRDRYIKIQKGYGELRYYQCNQICRNFVT